MSAAVLRSASRCLTERTAGASTVRNHMKSLPVCSMARSFPALGLGTWRLGESVRSRAQEVAAIRRAFELGYRLIDTAEMYGEGGAEEVVGEALAEAIAAALVRREEVFIVTKVYPHNASASGVARACDRSRKRLRLDLIDLYLLHWRGRHPLAETVAGFEALRAQRRDTTLGGVQFRHDDMQELWRLPDGPRCVANQVYYSASQRGIEFDLLPWQREHSVATMAYCPIDQGTLAADRRLGADRAAPRPDGGPGRARVGNASSGRHRDTEGRARRPPA